MVDDMKGSMVEGKTLKDITGMDAQEFVGIGKDYFMKYDDDLKHEAIKWIKEIILSSEDYIQLSSSNYKIGFYCQAEKGAVIEWIKHFFNLTEDDLK